jgi:hypothetical protein
MGAPVVVPPDAPAVCFSLAGSAAIRSIPNAVAELSNPTTASSGAAELRHAASDLRAMAATAGDTLFDKTTDAADALERLADKGISNDDASAAASAALAKLGEEVQDQCHFPLGAAA